MNVFMLTSVPMAPPWDQGDKNLAYALTQALQGHHFGVVTQRRGPAPQGKNLDLLPIYRKRAPALSEKAQVYWYLQRRNNHQGALDEWRNAAPDLYHLIYRPTYWSSLLSRWLPAFKERPTLHTIPALNLDGGLDPRLFFADRLVVVSEFAFTLLREIGIKNAVHIPVGIDPAPWSNLAAQRAKFRSELKIDSRPVILYPGHFAHGYGAEVILQILPALKARFPDLLLICACRLRSLKEVMRERKVKGIIASLGIEENVRFYNTVEDMQPLIAASDLTILPLETTRDKLDIPTTLLESLAAKVPIIISDMPPVNELLEELSGHEALRKGETTVAEAGVAIPPGDPAALARAILALLDDAGLRRRMGERGQALVCERFNIHKIAKKYEEIYTEMTA